MEEMGKHTVNITVSLVVPSSSRVDLKGYLG